MYIDDLITKDHKYPFFGVGDSAVLVDEGEISLGYPYRLVAAHVNPNPYNAGTATMETLTLIGGLVFGFVILTYIGTR
jgi:hypothetical protein